MKNFELSNGILIPIIINTKAKLKNITMRPKFVPQNELHISKPYFINESYISSFIEKKRGWIEKVFLESSKQDIKNGDKILILGKEFLIKNNSSQKINTYLDDTIVFGGSEEMLKHRFKEFLKKELIKETKKIILSLNNNFFIPKKITIKDTSSRWGSCSSNSNISLSIRIAFAPYNVFRYVVIHELSHLKYMNHSKDFWKTVYHLYGDGVGSAKLWLMKNGTSLQKYNL